MASKSSLFIACLIQVTLSAEAPVNYVRSITREGGPPPAVPGPDFDDGQKDYPDYVVNYNNRQQRRQYAQDESAPGSLGTVRLGGGGRRQRLREEVQPRRRPAQKAQDAIKDIVLNYDGKQEDGGEVAKQYHSHGHNPKSRAVKSRQIGPQLQKEETISETGKPKSQAELEYEKQMKEYLEKKKIYDQKKKEYDIKKLEYEEKKKEYDERIRQLAMGGARNEGPDPMESSGSQVQIPGSLGTGNLSPLPFKINTQTATGGADGVVAVEPLGISDFAPSGQVSLPAQSSSSSLNIAQLLSQLQQTQPQVQVQQQPSQQQMLQLMQSLIGKK